MIGSPFVSPFVPSVLSGRFEEGVAEDPVSFCRPVEVPDPVVELGLLHHPCRQGRIPDPFDHGGEGLPREPLRHLRPAAVGVDHPGRDGDLGEARPGEEGIELPPDHGVSARSLLEPHLAVDRPPGGKAIGVEVGGAVITLYRCDRPAGLYELLEGREGLDGPRQMFQNEADEEMVEGPLPEGEVEDVPLEDPDVFEVRGLDLPLRLGGGGSGDVEGDYLCLGAVFGEGDGLGSDAAARFQDEGSWRVGGVGVKEVDEGRGLVLEPGALFWVVAVDVGIDHDRLFSGCLYQHFLRRMRKGTEDRRWQWIIFIWLRYVFSSSKLLA